MRDDLNRMTDRRGARRELPRIPLNTLAISFGLAGLAALWTTETSVLHLPAVIPSVLWFGAAVAWVSLIVAHTIRGARSEETLASQLMHPAQGPIAAIVPIVGMLLGVQLHVVWPLGGVILALGSLLAAAGFAAWILAFWHTGRLNPEAFHGAYLLPTVAAMLIAATVCAKLGLPLIAVGSFAVGVFFWIVLVTVLLSRLAFFPPLPDPLTPTLAILVAPPAVAGTAWFELDGVRADVLSASLLGLMALMILMQVFLIPVYRRLPFTLGFWSFTFPAAAAAGYGVEWLGIARFAGWATVALLVGLAATAVIVAIGIRSLILVTSVRWGARRAEQSLRRADDAVTRPSARV